MDLVRNYVRRDSPPQSGLCSKQNQREHMEDRSFYAAWYATCSNPTVPRQWLRYEVYGVLDGHGGLDAVEYVKKWLPWLLAHYVSAALARTKVYDPSRMNKGKIEGAIKRCFVALQEQMRAYNHASPEKDIFEKPFEITGTTVCIMLRNIEWGWVINLGDSRAILCQRRPKALTKDHKPQSQEERDRITRLGGSVWAEDQDVWRVEPVGLATSRSLGDLDSRRLKDGSVLPHGAYLVSPVPDVRVLRLQKNHKDRKIYWLLFATDGLWDAVSNQQACLVVANGKSAALMAKQLVDLAILKKSTDNITVMVVPICV